MTRAVAVDLGSRRIGVAVSDRAGTLAFPRPYIARRGDRPAEHRAIAAVADEIGADVVVVGLPLSLDGSSGPAATAAVQEADELSAMLEQMSIRVEMFDERLTTVSAQGHLAEAGKRGPSQRQSVDSAAAAVLLQAWLAAR